MQEAWIQMECPACESVWEATVADLPTPDDTYQCDHCDASGRLAQFTKTARDLEVLREFNE